MQLTQLDLCSGVGAGFCLAGLQHGFNLIGTAEIDEYCSGILELRYPGTHNYGDVQSLAYNGGFGLSLYKYLENKKLKNGSVVSYPRVIGHREPDNPTHWRWGFNWEEKIDGEWKGRSIGSVPVGAIALIQSMQNEGVSLEEIIGFIRRAKAKN